MSIDQLIIYMILIKTKKISYKKISKILGLSESEIKTKFVKRLRFVDTVINKKTKEPEVKLIYNKENFLSLQINGESKKIEIIELLKKKSKRSSKYTQVYLNISYLSVIKYYDYSYYISIIRIMYKNNVKISGRKMSEIEDSQLINIKNISTILKVFGEVSSAKILEPNISVLKRNT